MLVNLKVKKIDRVEILKMRTIEYDCEKLISDLSFEKGLEIEKIGAKLEELKNAKKKAIDINSLAS